jgi:hypothetical protein
LAPVIPAQAGIQNAAASETTTTPVIPAQAGIQRLQFLDSRFRGNDGHCGVLA